MNYSKYQKCCVKNCVPQPNASFHRHNKNTTNSRKKNIVAELFNLPMSTTGRVCSAYFEPTDIRVANGRVWLHPNANPIIWVQQFHQEDDNEIDLDDVVSATFHPLEYAKVLIQLGYEPIAPRPGKSLFRYPVLVLPNVFKYVNYIRQVDGIVGCYRGLTPKLIGIIISSLGSEKIALKLGFEKILEDKTDQSNNEHNNQISDDESDKKFLRELKRDIVLLVSTVTLSHPFQVISVRMMAQFIGNETTYKTIWSSIKEIWNTEGIFGFFSGFTPKLLCEVSCLVIASSATYMINKHIVRDRSEHVGTLTNFVAASFFYPLQVVSTCMKVTGSRLKAGQPPQMPIYESWSQCWRELKATGDDKRGNSMFFRYYARQPVFRSEVPFPKFSK